MARGRTGALARDSTLIAPSPRLFMDNGPRARHGEYRSKREKERRAGIGVDGCLIHLGTFDCSTAVAIAGHLTERMSGFSDRHRST